MHAGLVVSLVSITAIAIPFGIVVVFGVLPAVAALLLFVAFACVLAVPTRHLEYTQVQWRTGR